MKNLTIGYLFYGKIGDDENAFIEEAQKRGHHLIFFNIAESIDEKELRRRAGKCDIIYNNSAEEPAIELSKSLEELGKKVIDSSYTYYYIEDKWMFYLKCKKHKIPCPKTILLPTNIAQAKKEIKKFCSFPVVLKRVDGCCGEFVDRANNLSEAEQIIKKFWKKGGERLPIIAQEFIKSKSYRITVIDGEIVQTVIKNKTGWKSTAVYQKKAFLTFKVNKELKKSLKKMINAVSIKVFGADYMKKGRKWLALEINAQPDLGFFPEERGMLVEKIFDVLEKRVKYAKT